MHMYIQQLMRNDTMNLKESKEGLEGENGMGKCVYIVISNVKELMQKNIRQKILNINKTLLKKPFIFRSWRDSSVHKEHMVLFTASYKKPGMVAYGCESSDGDGRGWRQEDH